MATILRMLPPSTGDSRRWVIGVLVSSDCTRLATTILACTGRGLDLVPEIIDGMTAEVPGETIALFRQLAGPAVGGQGTGKMPLPPTGATETLPTLRARLAELQASVVNTLLDQAGLAQGRALAIGVHDPGLWSSMKREAGGGRREVGEEPSSTPSPVSHPRFPATRVPCPVPVLSPENRGNYLGLCDAARLAELTGLSVVDAFPARDVASGGQGGPLTPLAQWLLLKDPLAGRLLLDLGRTTRATYLPRTADAGKGDRHLLCEAPSGPFRQKAPVTFSGLGTQGEPRVLSFDVGPGMSLLDMLVERLTDGEEAFDPGGRYAVQGRRVQELIDHWLADPYLRRPLPRWHPRGVRPERFLLEAVQMAVERGWSIRDLLCSATHFIAESVGLAVHLRMPSDLAVDQIILTGGGRHNGMLLRELGAVFPGLPLLPIEDIGIEAEALGPACYGLLALFYLDQVPANRPEVTGADLCRVLGRLTPGSPQSWQRLVAEMADARPTVRPLRSAL